MGFNESHCQHFAGKSTDNLAILHADTYPDREKMAWVVGTNEQLPEPADYSAPVMLFPRLAQHLFQVLQP